MSGTAVERGLMASMLGVDEESLPREAIEAVDKVRNYMNRVNARLPIPSYVLALILAMGESDPVKTVDPNDDDAEPVNAVPQRKRGRPPKLHTIPIGDADE